MGKDSYLNYSATAYLSFPFFYLYLSLLPLVGDFCTLIGETFSTLIGEAFSFFLLSNSCLFVSFSGDNSLYSFWVILAVFFRDAEADLDLDAVCGSLFLSVFPLFFYALIGVLFSFLRGLSCCVFLEEGFRGDFSTDFEKLFSKGILFYLVMKFVPWLLSVRGIIFLG